MAEGIAIPAGLYNALLYVSSGGGCWDHYARGREGPPPQALADPGTELRQRGGVEGGRGQGMGGRGGDLEPGDGGGGHVDPEGPPVSKEDLINATEAIWQHMKVRHMERAYALALASWRVM